MKLRGSRSVQRFAISPAHGGVAPALAFFAIDIDEQGKTERPGKMPGRGRTWSCRTPSPTCGIPIGNRAVARTVFGLAILLSCLSGSGLRARQYRVTATTRVTLTLPDTAATGENFLRGKADVWQPLQGQFNRKTITVTVEPDQLDTGGSCTLLLHKPAWMNLQDDAPPKLTECSINGTSLTLHQGRLEPGVLAPAGNVVIRLSCTDQANPLDPSGATCEMASPLPPPVLRSEGMDGRSRQGTLVATFVDPAAGAYRGTILIRDRAPDHHALRLPFAFTIIGISRDDKAHCLRMATAAGEYRFQADREKQLRLPNGIWAKLTSNIGGTWLYPREIVSVSPIETFPGGQRVTVVTNTQGIKGDPIEHVGRLEYTFTVRRETPCLMVTSRTINTGNAVREIKANWGWLPGRYYVLADGRKTWRGKATNSYIDIGPVGWLWLAPMRRGQAGTLWISKLVFGESRFDTMLLYAATHRCRKDEFVSMTFAIGPATDPKAARAMVDTMKTTTR